MQKPEFFDYTTQLCSSCGHKFTSICGGHGLACLARTPHEPTNDHSREWLRSRLGELEAGLQNCNTELARIQATMRHLQLHKASIEDSITDTRALIAPVRSLPPEILREIATYTLPPRWFDDSIGVHAWPFTQVCRTWREIAFGLRWPWADFRLPYVWANRRMRSESLVAAVNAYTKRSGQYPLLVGVWPSDSEPETSWAYMYSWLWKIIWANAERLQALDIVNSAVNRIPYPSLPALTWLAIRADPLANFQDAVALPETKLVPNLRSLQLSFVGTAASHGFDWSMLHALDVKCERLDDLHVVSMCSNLVKLRMHSGPGILPSNAIHLPSLERLCVGGAAVELCPFIRAPNLTHFIFDAKLAMTRGMMYYLEERYLLGRYAFLLEGLLAPVITLVLRNVYSYSADTLYGILLLPHRLREFYFISGELEPRRGPDSIQWCWPPDHVHYELAHKLVLDKSCPALVDLELVVFHNQRGPTKGKDLEEEAELVQDIWQSRGPPRHSGVLRSHLRLLVPMVSTDELVGMEDLFGYSNKGKCMPGDWDTLQWIFALD
ncbi:hypothetical protein K525DRAFT_193805 [Schizophyllum commune Loenen D]|nr:hypothetical protein K525DRAFT_193805 [Schizophyllum commune Loenen D]